MSDDIQKYLVPPTIEDEFEKPSAIGDLTDAELELLRSLQDTKRQHMLSIGQLEVQKARLFSAIAQVEDQMQGHLQKVAQRLGIPQNQQWTITNDGKARVMVPEELGTPKEA